MTQNQIRFQEHLENVTHNRNTEAENVRSHRANETILWDQNRINEEHYKRADEAAYLNANAQQAKAAAAYNSSLAQFDANAVHREANAIQRDWNIDYGNVLRANAAANIVNSSSNSSNANANQQNAASNRKNAETNRLKFFEETAKDTSSELRSWLNPFGKR